MVNCILLGKVIPIMFSSSFPSFQVFIPHFPFYSVFQMWDQKSIKTPTRFEVIKPLFLHRFKY